MRTIVRAQELHDTSGGNGQEFTLDLVACPGAYPLAEEAWQAGGEAGRRDLGRGKAQAQAWCCGSVLQRHSSGMPGL